MLAHGMLGLVVAMIREGPAMIGAVLLVTGIFVLMACRRPGSGDYQWG